MRRTVLVVLLALGACGAGAGCMKPSAPAAAPVLTVPVARLDGPNASSGVAPVSGPAPRARVANDLDSTEPHAPGDRVEVEQHGVWLPATLLERRGDRWLVHYDERRASASDELEELVEQGRIRAPLRPRALEDDSDGDDVDP